MGGAKVGLLQSSGAFLKKVLPENFPENGGEFSNKGMKAD